MAGKSTDSGGDRVTEIIGTSQVSWEEAAKCAVEPQPSRSETCVLPR
jgi:Dodecin